MAICVVPIFPFTLPSRFTDFLAGTRGSFRVQRFAFVMGRSQASLPSAGHSVEQSFRRWQTKSELWSCSYAWDFTADFWFPIRFLVLLVEARASKSAWLYTE